MPRSATETAPFYAVVTTGVYCRRGCRSRPPRPENVRHFTSAEGAEAAGFRACLRCRPRDAATPEVARVTAAIRRITNAVDEPSLDELASAAGLSRFHFLRTFKSVTGMTPKQYARGSRAGRLRGELKSGASVTAATYRSGYGSSSGAHGDAVKQLGMTPAAYRNGAAGQAIRYALVHTSLDWLLVAATDRGVCFVALGDGREGLVKELRAEFPNAELSAGNEQFDAWVAAVVSLVDSPSSLRPKLPVDVRGTAFQHLVWRALQAIPAGTTMTYGELAASLGKPSATRAVARACATNPVALAVPCHRVVGSGGELRGYRWGVERKRALIDRERRRT